MKEVVVILDNVRSAHNVGSIFRTSDAAGVKKIYLVGITPAPVDRFGRVQPEIKKTSLGATESVAWEKVGEGTDVATDEAYSLVNNLKDEGYEAVVVEQVPNSISLADYKLADKTVYIFGAEVEGVQPELIAAADQALEIPMLGEKESLNVSVTAGIVLFK